MRLGFIGCGVVGGATVKLAEHYGHQPFRYDPDKGFTGEDFSDCEAIFVAVPVPTMSNGKQDHRALWEAVSRAAKFNKPIFVRSSVLPGTCESFPRRLQVYAMPEFLTERRAESDIFQLPLLVPIAAEPLIRKLFPRQEIITVESNSAAELVKYAHNSFCAMKVGFFNTINQLCEAKHLSYNDVVTAVTSVTAFVGKEHTSVPGPDHNRGFGGKCLPKDLKAFANMIEKEIGPTFLTQVMNENFHNRFGALF